MSWKKSSAGKSLAAALMLWTTVTYAFSTILQIVFSSNSACCSWNFSRHSFIFPSAKEFVFITFNWHLYIWVNKQMVRLHCRSFYRLAGNVLTLLHTGSMCNAANTISGHRDMPYIVTLLWVTSAAHCQTGYVWYCVLVGRSVAVHQMHVLLLNLLNNKKIKTRLWIFS